MPRQSTRPSREAIARDLASILSHKVPASLAVVCLDLKCRPRQVHRAIRDLVEYGVHITGYETGLLLVDPETWPACQVAGA